MPKALQKQVLLRLVASHASRWCRASRRLRGSRYLPARPGRRCPGRLRPCASQARTPNDDEVFRFLASVCWSQSEMLLLCYFEIRARCLSSAGRRHPWRRFHGVQRMSDHLLPSDHAANVRAWPALSTGRYRRLLCRNGGAEFSPARARLTFCNLDTWLIPPFPG